MTFELGEAPILICRGENLVVQDAYKTNDGRWHEIIVSNGEDLSASEQNPSELAKKIQQIWASCMKGVEQQSEIIKVNEPSQVGFRYDGKHTDVWFVKEAGKTAQDFLKDEKIEAFRTENERATYFFGDLIKLPSSASVLEKSITNVHEAMVYLESSLRSPRVEQGLIQGGENEELEKIHKFNRQVLQRFFPIFQKRLIESKFPFTQEWKYPELLVNWKGVPESEKKRIQEQILKDEPDEEVVSLFKEVDDQIAKKVDPGLRPYFIQLLLDRLGFVNPDVNLVVKFCKILEIPFNS